MDSDLLATCNALGYLEEDRYFKEPDCLDTVKCLIKFLHQEDNQDIRLQLGSGHVLRNDLLPILRHYPEDEALCAAVLRLLVNLTQPALLCFGNKIPSEVDQYHNYLNILHYNQAYKQDFSDDQIWKVLAQKVYDILEKDWEDRLPDDSVTVERILVLCRNVLHVPASDEDEKQSFDRESSHDKLIIAMHNAGIDSMILYLASSTTEQQWCLHVAEIISLFLKEQKPEDIAKFNNQQQGPVEDRELKNIRLEEGRRKQMRVLQQSSRHSRFGGTFVAKGMPALADNNDLVVHKALQKCGNISFDDGKSKLRKAKNRRPVYSDIVKRQTTPEVRHILKEFCLGLLENGYNHLMFNIRDKISRERSDDHDETYYFNIMSFMLEFNRNHKFHIDQVSETVQVAILHFIDVSMTNCMDLMMTDKQECKTWGKRMHWALKCYKEFLLTIQLMQVSKNESFVESAKVLLNNIFYTPEYREVFLLLFQKYDQSKLSHEYLEDLVQTTHLFLRLFEKYCKGESVIVQKKRKTVKKRKKQMSNPAAMSSLSEEQRKSCWDEVEELVKNHIQANDLPNSDNVSDIFDPTSDVTEDEQQQRALVKLQSRIHGKEIPEAVSLLRQARELWPEIDVFGIRDSTWEDDMNTLKEICLADLLGLKRETNPPNLEDVEEEEKDEEEEVRISSKEITYNFNDYLRKFAVVRVIQPYVTLLAKFDTNNRHTNHCIVKLLHRVCFDLKMYGLLFQASVFRIFQRLFKAATVNPSLKELAGFGKYIVKKFFETLPRNDKIYAELLFWKQSVAQVYELTEGYGTFSKNQGPKEWTESEQAELKQLYEEFKDSEHDVIDCILTRITDETRNRRQVVKQLIMQGLVDDVSLLKRKKSNKRFVWREHDEMELKALFEEFKNSEDPLGNIIGMMSTKRSKPKVIEKLLAMGIVQDRKELYKRRAGTNARRGGRKEPEIMHAGGSESEDDTEQDLQEPESDDDDEWLLIDLRSCIRKVTSDGFRKQIDWVKENLEQAIDDRNQFSQDSDEELQPLPLVPLLEEQEDAIQNKAFRKMLFFLGLQRPIAGQEMFWRIPPVLTVQQLQENVGVLSTPDESATILPRSGDEKLSNAEESEAVRVDVDCASGNKRDRSSDSDEELAVSDNETMKVSIKRRKRIAADEESDEDPDQMESTNFPGGSTDRFASDVDMSTAKVGHSKRRLLMDDSDEEESDKENIDAVSGQICKNKHLGEDDEIRPNRRGITISDDDDE